MSALNFQFSDEQNRQNRGSLKWTVARRSKVIKGAAPEASGSRTKTLRLHSRNSRTEILEKKSLRSAKKKSVKAAKA